MTYRSRGRSIVEVILATIFVGFLVGFICVLCIGNYFRAKRAMERQRQRRLARLNPQYDGDGKSHRSQNSGSSSIIYSEPEQQALLSASRQNPKRPANNRSNPLPIMGLDNVDYLDGGGHSHQQQQQQQQQQLTHRSQMQMHHQQRNHFVEDTNRMTDGADMMSV